MRRFHWIALSTAVAVQPTLSSAQQVVEFSGRQWTLGGDAKVEQYLGRPALRMGSGRALAQELRFQDGTIEFDFATTGHRSFAGVFFRYQDSNRDGEYVYLRPHQSNRFDAVQYTPLDSGMTAWQLYPEHNAQVSIPSGQWIHVRLEVSGHRLQVFVGDSDEPTLTARLRRGIAEGRILLTSGAPRGDGINSPEGTFTTAYSNFAVTSRPAATMMEATEPDQEGIIKRWSLSPAVTAPQWPLETPPAELMDHADWIEAESDEIGRLSISRYRGMPEGDGRGLVLARAVIRSDRSRTVKMYFGFSDQVSVFLNGQVLYSADNGYLARSERYLGVMTLGNDVLYLPLRQGENELILAVSESFGGWGVGARLEDTEGLTVLAGTP